MCLRFPVERLLSPLKAAQEPRIFVLVLKVCMRLSTLCGGALDELGPLSLQFDRLPVKGTSGEAEEFEDT